MLKIIDVSGFGHSGKTAVTDLLREVEGIYVHHSSFEFGLLRLPDGLVDLKRNILDNWTPIKSDFAIKRFVKLTHALSDNYSEMLNEHFSKYTREYIDSLVHETAEIQWYDGLYDFRKSLVKDKVKKLLITLGIMNMIRKHRNNLVKKELVYLADSKDFILNTRKYLENVLGVDGKNATIVTNNAFEPFNPIESMNFFSDPYCVVVERDPRDIYLSSLMTEGLFVPDFEKKNPNYSYKYMMNLKKDFLNSNNIDTFIWRQKTLRESIKVNNDNERVIRIRYEDLINNYEETVTLLFKKLDIDTQLHRSKQQYFNPENSKKNVGLWKKKNRLKEILQIEKELGEYIYN